MTNRPSRSDNHKSTILWASLLALMGTLGLLLIAVATGMIRVDWEALVKSMPTERHLQSAASLDALATEPTAHDWYRIYFTVPASRDDPARRVDAIETALIEIIDSASESLELAIYEFDLKDVAEALLAAHDRGVTVRIVTDSDTLAEDDSLVRLVDAGIPIETDERSAIMHNKFVVIDREAIWTGSWNLTDNGTFRNNNNAIYVRSTRLAQNYATEFEEMFGEQAFGPASPANTPYPRVCVGQTLIETCFAPEDGCGDRVIALIGQAQRTVRFMAYYFTHDGIGQAIRQQAMAGIAVQGVFETRNSQVAYSEYGRMKQAGLDVWPDGNPYLLHHKVLIIDDEIVVTGSFNFTASADDSNDENLLVIHDAGVAAHYLAEFERVLEQAKSPQE